MIMASEKIKTQDELSGIIVREKSMGRKVGFTNGCFDILHRGHVDYLRKARGCCDILVVGLNSDSSVKAIKGEGRPLNPQEARLDVLSVCEPVDYVTVFEESTPEKLIIKLDPDVIFKGGDWKESDIVGADHVKAKGGEVRVIPYLEGYSTTRLIEKIRGTGG